MMELSGKSIVLCVTGGIAAYKVAEQFRVLDALAPGRIDLGVGRAPGTGAGLMEDYLRASRRARAVTESLFYESQ